MSQLEISWYWKAALQKIGRFISLKTAQRASILFSLAVLCFFNIAPVNALTAGDFHSINTNTAFYDPTDNGSACGSDSNPVASTSTATTAQSIASNLIVGLDASSSNAQAIATDLATKYQIGGIYLVDASNSAVATKNDNALQKGFNKSFYQSLNKAAGHTLVVASDEEGAVTRYYYPGGFPTARQMAQKSDDAVTALGKSLGSDMAGFGLTTDLGPVLDLRDVGNLPGRSFSSNPSVVADKAGAFASGLQSSGITPIFKHFPGFDDTTSGTTDNQKIVMTGNIDKTVAPYKALLAKFPKAGVMLSNMYVTKLDSANPSSMSAATVKYLRSTLNFKGMITTDDLSVQSVTNKAGSLGDAVADSFAAGVDMPLFTLAASSTSDAENGMDKIIGKVQNNSAAMSSINNEASVVSAFTGNSDSSSPSSTNSSIAASCCSSDGSGDTGATLTGSDNQQQMFNFFVNNMGYTAQQAAGATGSMMLESGLNPTATNGGSGAFGVAQWLGGRLTSLQKLTNYKTFAVQVHFIQKELNGDYQTSVNDRMKKATTYEDAQNVWTWYYEGLLNYPDQWYTTKRNNFAQAVLQKYGGQASNTTPGTNIVNGADTSCAAVANGTSPDCTNAQGLAKILCAAKAYDTASYDYGAQPRTGPAWHKQCPTIGPSCTVDCSLLVTLAVYDAFGVVLPGTDTQGERDDVGTYWKHITFKELQPGDIIQPDPGHVEVVDHIKGPVTNKNGKIVKPGVVYTFGAHDAYSDQTKDVSPSSYVDGPNNNYFQYIGPQNKS